MAAPAPAVEIDGSFGEGGGQILRTSLTLSALTGRPVRVHNIRAGRSRPGLRPQHMAAVHAVGAVCQARVSGCEVGASALTFEPTAAPQAGAYSLDVSRLAGTASAGSVTLVFQAVWLALARLPRPSTVELIGGTHVPWSPPHHYISQVYLPTARRVGFRAEAELLRWGWYPRGEGRISATIPGAQGAPDTAPLALEERGRLEGVWVLSAASNLPDHIVQRQADAAVARLRSRRIKAQAERVSGDSVGVGTMTMVLAQYQHAVAGFSAYGRLRYPAERVAQDAVAAFEAYHASRAAVDPHLADQLLLPLALTQGTSVYTCSEVTRHLLTNAWVIQQFLPRDIVVEGREGEPGRVAVC